MRSAPPDWQVLDGGRDDDRPAGYQRGPGPQRLSPEEAGERFDEMRTRLAEFRKRAEEKEAKK